MCIWKENRKAFNIKHKNVDGGRGGGRKGKSDRNRIGKEEWFFVFRKLYGKEFFLNDEHNGVDQLINT